MQSIKFPKMFNTNSTNTFKKNEYKKATAQNAILLLKSGRNELFGDPYFGTMLKQYLFEPNNYIMEEMLKDTIYTQLALFIPQLRIERKDIKIVRDRKKGKVYCYFKGTNQIDFTVDTFDLIMYQDSTVE